MKVAINNTDQNDRQAFDAANDRVLIPV